MHNWLFADYVRFFLSSYENTWNQRCLLVFSLSSQAFPWEACTSSHAWRAQDVRFIARLNKLKLVKKTFLPALGLKQCSLKQLLCSLNNLLCSNYARRSTSRVKNTQMRSGNMAFLIRHLCFTSARDPGTPAPLPFFPNFSGQSILFSTLWRQCSKVHIMLLNPSVSEYSSFPHWDFKIFNSPPQG